MNRQLLLVIFLLFGSVRECPAKDRDRDLQILIKQGRGTAAGREAWDRIVAGGPSLLPVLLKAMDTNDTVAANWLRSAFDQIADKANGKGVDVDGLLGFAQDAKRQGRARRLALEVVEKLRPGTSAKLYPGWLDDPEFRFQAVAVTLDDAKKLAKEDAKKALAIYRTAFEKSRDVQQARQAALGLRNLGVKVSVGEHLGFLMDWYMVGPFDGMGMKGFRTEYPPEKSVDLKAEYQGQGKKVRWIRHRVQETPPSAGGGHQALVNLRHKDALGDADDAVAFAYTEFVVDKAQVAEFRGAADDNFTIWVNGKKEFAFEEYRNGVRLDRHRFKVNLRAGKNTVLVKICQTPAPNPEPNWEFFLRVVDDTGRGIAMKNALVGKVDKTKSLLSTLEKLCQKMLEMQRVVNQGTTSLHQTIESHSDKKAGPKDRQNSLKLAAMQKAILAEASKAREMLRSESAVAFPEVFDQVRADMKRVQDRLAQCEFGRQTQAIERDIVDTLKEMIEPIRCPKKATVSAKE